AGMRGGRQQMDQRVARRVQSCVSAAAVAVTGAEFENDAAAADRGHVVANSAAGTVVSGAEPFLGGFDLGEIIEPQSKLAELGGRDTRQGAAGRLRGLCLTRGVDREQGDPGYRRADQNPRHGATPVAAGRTMMKPRIKFGPGPPTRVASNT